MKTEIELWEILVPCSMIVDGQVTEIEVEYHRRWDEIVRQIAGGLTIFKPAKGQWLSQQAQLFHEEMIPVRIACTQVQMDEIADHTARYYNQLAVMYYRVSEFVRIKHYAK